MSISITKNRTLIHFSIGNLLTVLAYGTNRNFYERKVGLNNKV